MKQHLKSGNLWLGLLAMAVSFNAAAQTGEGYSGSAINSGTATHSGASFSILTGGIYDGATYGSGVDNFVGPDGAAGTQAIDGAAGTAAPQFGVLNFNNGSTNIFNITHPAGAIVAGSVAFNNGVTTTVRTTRTAGLLGALQFLASATYTPTLVPALGTDVTFTDGYVSKVNPSSFVYPVGSGNDLRTITVTGTGTFATAWSNTNVNTIYTGALPSGVTAINTNGYWEWAPSAAATVTVSIPAQTGAVSSLTIVGYNGTAWTNLGGTFTTNAENSSNTAAVNVPANITAIAVGNPFPFIQVSPSAFLQGAMIGSTTTMRTTLRTNTLLPATQPYTGAQFTYAGTEKVFGVLPTNMTDWILVDVRDQNTHAILGTAAALLLSDGTITGLDGTSPVAVLNVSPGTYYVGIRHRNHLAIRSSSTYALTVTTTVVDFRTVAANTYNDVTITSNAAQKNMGNGTFAMWGGNATTTIAGAGSIRITGSPSINDLLGFLTAQGGTATVFGTYSVGDFNLDGNIRSAGTPVINDLIFLVNTLGSQAQKVQHL